MATCLKRSAFPVAIVISQRLSEGRRLSVHRYCPPPCCWAGNTKILVFLGWPLAHDVSFKEFFGDMSMAAALIAAFELRETLWKSVLVGTNWAFACTCPLDCEHRRVVVGLRAPGNGHSGVAGGRRPLGASAGFCGLLVFQERLQPPWRGRSGVGRGCSGIESHGVHRWCCSAVAFGSGGIARGTRRVLFGSRRGVNGQIDFLLSLFVFNKEVSCGLDR